MRRSLVLVFFAVVVAAGCSSANSPGDNDAGPCGPCTAGEGCDVANSACAPGGSEGTLCGPDAPDGGLLICQDGLSCNFVAGGTHVCLHACTTAADCGSGRACYQADLNGEISQYCATQVALGDACGPAQLLQCSGGSNGQTIQCINSGTDAGSRCMLRCDTDADCSAGQACSVAFGDGNGVCGARTQQGDPCDQSKFVFCTAGQVCVVVRGTAGFCHDTCPSGDPASCGTGQSCIYPDPCGSSSQPFCVTPQPIDGGCDALQDQFCGADADCVNLGSNDAGAVLLCKPDCSSGGSCAAGSCSALPVPDQCRSACF